MRRDVWLLNVPACMVHRRFVVHTRSLKTVLPTIALLLAATTTSFAQQTTAATEATPVCTAPHQNARVLGVPSVDAPTNADGAGGTIEKISEQRQLLARHRCVAGNSLLQIPARNAALRRLAWFIPY